MTFLSIYRSLHHQVAKMLPDSIYISLTYPRFTGRPINLRHPKTFNEKIQWLKIHDRKPIYVKMADKLAAKDFVAKRVGGEYVVPLLGSWKTAAEIDFDALPSSFVLKTTHSSGGNVICRDKSKLDREAAMKLLQDSLNCNFYEIQKEWVYKDIPRRIIAEPLLSPLDGGEVVDYKFLVFGGKARVMFVATNRHKEGGAKFNYFDMEWNPIPVVQPHHMPNEIMPNKPKNFCKMVDIAETLSQGTYFLRVDFYEIDGKVFFGEMTFYPDGGLEPFIPASYEVLFGSWIKLPCDGK